MKKSKLRQIIREEISSIIREDWKSKGKKMFQSLFPKYPPEEVEERAFQLWKQYKDKGETNIENKVAAQIAKEFPEWKKQAKKIAAMAGFSQPARGSAHSERMYNQGKSYDPFDPFQPW